jgi:hypothetical protein
VSAALLAVSPAADADWVAKTTLVAPQTLIQLAGTDTYCTVLKESVGPTVACFHDPGGPSSPVRKGYAIAAADKLVAVEPSGSTTPVKLFREPSFAKVPAFGPGRPTSMLVMHPNDLVEVGGTHMGIAAKPGQGGGTGLVVAYLDGKGKFIVGSYGVAIGDHFVDIVKASPSQQLRVAYEHAVYGK